MKKIAILLAVLLTACGYSLPGSIEKENGVPAGKRPNVVVILADDVGYSDIGAFGSEIATPHLDALAADGRLLSNFHTTALCATTRAELMTGVDHHLVGMGTLPELNQFYRASDAYAGSLNERAPTIAELLREGGYHTYMAGKWHLDGGGPAQQGFEQSFSLSYANAEASNFAPGAGGSSSTSKPYFENGVEAQLPADFFSSDAFTDKLLQYIAAGRGDGKPFFAYLAFQATHFPLQAPDKYLDLYRGRYDAGYDAIRAERLARQKELGLIPQDFREHPGAEALMARYGSPGSQLNIPWSLLSDSERKSEARIMEVFAAMLTNVDDNVGRLIADLKRSGEYDNTFIIFLSDNGADGIGTTPVSEPARATDFNNSLENFGRAGSYIYRSARWAEVGSTPFRLFKAFSAEGGISVPAIVRLPKAASNATGQPQSAVLSTLLDVAPTILELARVPRPGGVWRGQPIAELEGQSLLPALKGLREQVHAEDSVRVDEVNNIRYVRRGPWKLTRFVNYLIPPANLLLNHDWQLYNMDTDRGETTNVAAAHPEIVEELRAEWRSYVARVGVQQPNIPPMLTPIDD